MQQLGKRFVTTGLASNKRVGRRLKNRCYRAIRGRFRDRLELEIEQFLGSDYPKIGGRLPNYLCASYARSLNRSIHKSERLFLQGLIGRGVVDLFPNMILCNRWFGDVVFPLLGIVIECDGGHHLFGEQKKKDERKDYWLTRLGYVVTRVDCTREDNIVKAVEFFVSIIRDKASANSGSNLRGEHMPPAIK